MSPLYLWNMETKEYKCDACYHFGVSLKPNDPGWVGSMAHRIHEVKCAFAKRPIPEPAPVINIVFTVGFNIAASL